jgi:hypothetical protein
MERNCPDMEQNHPHMEQNCPDMEQNYLHKEKANLSYRTGTLKKLLPSVRIY